MLVTTNRAIEGVTGCVTYWQLPDHCIWKKLEAAWIKNGLAEEMLPKKPGIQQALAFVLRDKYQNRNGLVRNVPTNDNTSRWAVLPADKDEVTGLPAFKTAWTVTCKPEGLEFSSDCPQRCREEVEDLVASYDGVMTNQEVSMWLGQLMKLLDSTSLRNRGGVHFIPVHTMPIYELARKAALEGAGISIYSIPAMIAEDTAAAVMASLAEEAEEEANEYIEDIKECHSKGKEHGKMFNARVKRAGELIAKLQRYESIFGKNLDTLREKLKKLQMPACEVDVLNL